MYRLSARCKGDMFLQLHSKRKRRGRKPFVYGVLALVCSLTLTVFVTSRVHRGCMRRSPGVSERDKAEVVQINPWASLIFPTPQTRLLDEGAEGVFQTTASGRPESAFYGSTRTGSEGKRLVARFHEAIDIAPVLPRVRGRAQDPVFAVADGYVGYINAGAGRSNYGKYVVLLHKDTVGEVYTLYAHLADVESDLKQGESVHAGRKLGIMGNTPANIIPHSRSHLHFEVGLSLNSRFSRIAGHGGRAPIHGNFNGRNLYGLDPLGFYLFMRDHRGSFFGDYIKQVPVAAELVVGVSGIPDFFKRYPALWDGGPPEQGAMRLYVSEGGVPLRGRPETEIRSPGRGRAIVAAVDEDILGRNGKRLVLKRGGSWRVSAKGEEWVKLLAK